MMTLRERTHHFGIIVNLPSDHTANSVNAAAAAAFAAMPKHMRRTLTWDQGVEMARHQDITAETGVGSTSQNVPARGSAARTRTSMALSANTSRRAPICPCTPRLTSRRS